LRRPRATTPEEIDITNAAAVRAAVLQAAAHGHGMFAVDMTGNRFCDWAGLHVLLGAHRRPRAEGGEVLLVIASRAVLRSFTAALDRVIPNSTSLDEALAETPAAAARPPRPDPPGTDP
jgi:anti-sigma B factor antagonist